MDFNHPFNKVWEGYKNPYFKPCGECRRGWSPLYTNIKKAVYDFEDAESVACDIMKLIDINVKEADSSEIHDAIMKAGRDHGLTGKWHLCDTCDGEDIHQQVDPRYYTWEEYEPPTGDGYQLWETTSEGSPISPVFNDLDNLYKWAAENSTIFAHIKLTAEEWRTELEWSVKRNG